MPISPLNMFLFSAFVGQVSAVPAIAAPHSPAVATNASAKPDAVPSPAADRLPAPRQAKHPFPGWIDRMQATEITEQQAQQRLSSGLVDSTYFDLDEKPDVFLTSPTGEVSYFVPALSRQPQDFLMHAALMSVPVMAEESNWQDRFEDDLPFAIYVLLMAGLLGLTVYNLFRGPSRTGTKYRNGSKASAGHDGRQSVTFADVAGQDAAKRSLVEVVDFLKDPKKYERLGARVPKGVLLEGDPGMGKTLLARAVAGEAGVPFFSASGSQFVEMYVGVGAKRVRDLFAGARKHPISIVFIDEIETVGAKRSVGSRGAGDREHDQTINQLITELDGFDRSATVLLIAATNRADVLDSALTRPGRVDRRVFVAAPDVRGREAILGVHARRIRLSSGVSLAEIARITPGFSGADLANVMNEAALSASRACREAVAMDDVREVMDRILLGEERPAGAMSDGERRVVAYHEAGHAICAIRTPAADPVRRATIVPRGRALGAILQSPERDRTLWSLGMIKGRLTVAMGGRAAEEIILEPDDITGGASGDIRQATLLAREMIGRYGLNAEFGCLDAFGDGDRPNASADTLARLDRLAVQEIDAAASRAKAILKRDEASLHALASALMERETLDGDEVRAIVGAPTLQAEAP
jgi:cell division protease FtsH